MATGQFKQARESVSDREEEGFSAMDTSPDEVTHTPNVSTSNEEISVVSHTEETAVAEHLRPRTPQPLGSGSAYFSNRSGQVTARYVQAKIRKFKSQFKGIKKRFQESLENKNISVEEVIKVLKSLSADDDSDHKVYTESHLNILEEAHNQSALIGQLDFNMDYLSFHLLEYLVTEFDLEDVKVLIEDYKSNLQRFREKVPLSRFCEAQKGKQIKPMPDFREMVAELQCSPSSVMNLEVVEQFRQKYTTHYNLRCWSMVLARVDPGYNCFNCTWLIPASVVNMLKGNVHRAVFEENFCSKLSIAGDCVYLKRGTSDSSHLSGFESSYLASSQSPEDDFLFVEDPSDDYFCPVTNYLLMEPYLTSCCGKHFSQEAVKEIKKAGKKCPNCRSSKWTTMLNIHFQREVKELRVFCQAAECSWQGPLSELLSHNKTCHSSKAAESAKIEESTPSSSSKSQPQIGNRTVYEELEFIQEEVKVLQKKFSELKKECLEYLKVRNVPIEDFVTTLKSLKVDDNIEGYTYFTESHIRAISQAVDHSELFGALILNMNFFSHQLLDYFVTEFDLEGVKSEMEAYKSDLKVFCEKTPAILFCQAQPKLTIEPPPHFRTVISTFHKSDSLMLDNLEQFRIEYSYHHSLQNFTMTLAKAEVGSVAVTWFIPEAVVEKLLQESVPRKILRKYSISKLEIAGGCVYRLRTTQEMVAVTGTGSAESFKVAGVTVLGTTSLISQYKSRTDYPFVEQPSGDFCCPYTKGLLLEPYLTSCCGQHLSQEAVARIKKEKGKCPLCKMIQWSTMLDKHYQREVNSLLVFCHYKDRGCTWQGELSAFEYHVSSCPMKDTPLMKELPPQIRLKDKTRSTMNKISSAEFIPDIPTSKPESTQLMEAVSSGKVNDVRVLLLEGADPNAFPPMIQFTPLMEACKTGDVKMAQLLLDNNADPNIGNDENWNALMEAANNGHYGTVDILLERGANPDMQDNTGWSALMAAVFKRYDNIALRIIRAGAAPHIQDKNNTNALLLAIEHHKRDTVVDALLDNVNSPSQLDIQDSYGATALMYACKKNNLKLVRRLLNMGANPSIANNDGETPVMIAKVLGQEQIAQVIMEKSQTEGELPALDPYMEGSLMEDIQKHMEGADVVVSRAPLLKEQSFVYSGKKLNFIWKDAGISLHFPAAVCEGDVEISIKIVTNVEGNCILPRGYRLMPMASATYKIRASAMLPVPVRVRMEHCTVVENEHSLVHMVAHDGLPYRFEISQGGKCPIGKFYGEIEMTEFSYWAIICNSLGLSIRLAIHIVYFSNSKAEIIVTENVPPHCVAIENYGYKKNQTNYAQYTMRTKSSKISFVLEQSSKSKEELSIEMDSTVINMMDVYTYQPGSIPQHIKVEWKWKGDRQPRTEKVKIKIEGGDKDYVSLECSAPKQSPQPTVSSAVSAELRALINSYATFKSGVDPEYLVKALYSKGLLTCDEKESATQRMAKASEKLEILFEALKRRISTRPDHFHTLLQVLDEEPAMRGVFDKIKGIYNEVKTQSPYF